MSPKDLLAGFLILARVALRGPSWSALGPSDWRGGIGMASDWTPLCSHLDGSPTGVHPSPPIPVLGVLE